MKLTRVFIALFVLVSIMTTMVSAQKNDILPKLPVEEFRLKNGLRVILHRDDSTPIVAVNLWYHVGSKNEVVGRTGFAHLFEHMMFQGSKNYNDDYFKPLQEAGANINGSTNADRTNYFEVLPSNFLELALFMEADRLGGLLDAMTQDKLDNQRDVVKNERRQSYDNQPYGTAFEKISELIYPKDHPYNWTTIGSLTDLSNASMDDVKAFFRQYYVPNNTSLVIAGKFDAKQAKAWAEKYFGPIPMGNAITRPNPPTPKLDGEMRKTFEDAVQLPRLYMAWHTVAADHPDEPALDMLQFVLSSGRGSRLQSNLVYGKQIAQDAFASHFSREISGLFQVQSTVRPKDPKQAMEIRETPQKFLDPIEAEVNAEIARLKKEAPTQEEMTRALNVIESSTIFGMQTILGKADQMNSYATFQGKPNLFQSDLDRYRKVTPADIQRVANTYLNANRLVMSFVPRKGEMTAQLGGGAANTPTSTAAKTNTLKKDYSANLPKPGPNPAFALPMIDKKKLANGMNVWIVRQPELPIVSMNMVFNSGATADPQDRAGLASFTANLLNSGTKSRSAVDIANQLQSIGASVGASANWDSSNVSMQTLTKNLDKALDIYADIVTNPSFPESEFATNKGRSLIGLRQRKDNPNAIAAVAYSNLLYGKNHPYGKNLTGDQKSIETMTRGELEKFYSAHYRPNNATLIVVGDADAKTLLPKLETAFANFKPADVPKVEVPAAATFDKPGIYIIDKPGAAQSVVTIGQVGVARDNPDFFALQVMNSILGGQFSARVNMNLREDKGYTYGAGTGWNFRRGAGPFQASAAVQTAVTKESVVEFMKELNGIRGAIPVTTEELEYNKQSIIRRFPQGFETVGQISGQLSNLLVYGLSDSYFNDFIGKVDGVKLEDVNRVANKYLTPDKMAILIVGDRKTIESKLREIDGWGSSIRFLDTDGNPIAE